MDTPNPHQQPTTFNEVVLNRTLNQGNKYNIRLMRYLLDDLANVDSHQGIFLDVGGGWGHLTLLAKDLGFDAICLDRENISGMVNAVCCDIIEDTFPFPSNSVSVVFCKSTLEHLYVNQLPHFISEVQRVLKPGGKVILMTPDWDTNIRNFYTVFSHVTPYTSKSLKHLLMMYNFSDVHVHKLIQLPSTWDNKFMLYLSKFLKYTPLPRGLHKWIRWSKELSLVGIATKI